MWYAYVEDNDTVIVWDEVTSANLNLLIRTRMQGLMEIETDHIDYTYRTVGDWLQSVWLEIDASVASVAHGFSPELRIARVLLMYDPGPNSLLNFFWNDNEVLRMLGCATGVSQQFFPNSRGVPAQHIRFRFRRSPLC